MTREEKAKAYDEALDRMKHVVIAPKNEEALQALKETIFPELAESEDEKIRKDIINLIYWLKANPRLCSQYYIDRYDSILAYLEKQKGQKHSLNFDVISSWLRDHASNYVNGEFNEFHHCVDYDGTINVEKLIADLKVAVDIADLKAAVDGDAFDVDEQEEQAPIFRVGDTIIAKDGTGIPQEAFHIEKIEDGFYWEKGDSILISNQDEFQLIERKPIKASDDELQRHQDELYDFKVFATKQAREHHISYTHDFEWNNFCAGLLYYFNEKQQSAEIDEYEIIKKHISESSLSPEVNKRLKECGWYVTDEKPAECIVPPPSDPFMFNLHSTVYNFGKQIAAECLDTHILDTELDKYVTDENVDKYIKEHISYLVKYHPLQKPVECIEFDNEFKNQVSRLLASVLNKEWEYNKGFVEYTAQQLLGYAKHEIKTAKWSEEDENMLESILDEYKSMVTEKRNWLNSLPERFNLRPKRVWSEEEMSVLDSIIVDYEKANKSFCGYAGKITLLKAIRNGEYDLSKQEWSKEDEENFKWFDKFFRAESILIDGKDIPQDKYLWFKSLRPQPKQEWSEEDKQILSAAIDMVERGNVFFTFENNKWKVSDWLKLLPERFGLRPKQEWDEEDEQMLVRLLDSISIGNNYKEMRNWLLPKLKSLRTHPNTVSVENATKFGNLEYERGVKDGIQHSENHRWKPSEKQMKALDNAQGELCGTEYNEDLCSLIDDLQKL